MKDKLPPEAEDAAYNYSDKHMEQKAFIFGATYMQEQSKEAIQELVSALEANQYHLENHQYIPETIQERNRLLIQKHKQ